MTFGANRRIRAQMDEASPSARWLLSRLSPAPPDTLPPYGLGSCFIRPLLVTRYRSRARVIEPTHVIRRPGSLPASPGRSEEHTSELQSLMRNSYAVFCLKTKNK